MAKYVRNFSGDFDETLAFCESTMRSGSMSLSLEEENYAQVGSTKVAVRAYERYSWIGGNRVSLTLTLVGDGRDLHICAVATGGSQAMFFKLNTFGEESFLDTLRGALDNYINQSR